MAAAWRMRCSPCGWAQRNPTIAPCCAIIGNTHRARAISRASGAARCAPASRGIAPPRRPRFRCAPIGRTARRLARRPPVTVLFRSDLGVWDGRFAENGWLQEMSRPFTRLTWDNAAEIAPASAERLNLGQGDVVSVTRGQRHLDVPVWILPGQAENCVTLRLGYGRSRA